MKVYLLIQALQKLPQDAEVYHLWDGEPRTQINVVYESKSGDIITADFSQDCDSDEARPIGSPTVEEMQYWKTGENPNKNEFDIWDDED